jgi:hypothetical protein
MSTSFEYPMIGKVCGALDGTNIRIQASRSFNHAINHGKLNQFLARLFGKEYHLKAFSSQPLESHHSTSRIISVPIREIKGSLGRTDDFDQSFNPLNERSRDRWVSIAAAMKVGTPLPAVELVQVGDIYYVCDGHHRISVARSMDQEAIDARIVN